MYRILISDKLGQAGLDRLDEVEDASYDMKTDLSKDELLAMIPEYDALIVRSGTKVDKDVLEAGERLKVVGRAGIGVDNIDIREATMRGIIVMNTPTANSVATAEQTMALMLALSRHTAEAHASLKAGEWRRSEFVGVELNGKTLGIIGFGRIGRLVTQRAQAFGMEIVAFDPYVSEEVARELNVLLVDLDDLLTQSDYITLHTAATPETEKMINAETIAQMKPGVRIVNAARGKLIDEQALAEGLKNGKIAAAAVDVYSSEPPLENPLLDLPNVLHTPHLGASTIEAQHAVATQIVDQVLDALRGKDVRHALNLPFPAGPSFASTRPYMELAEKMGHLQAALASAPITRVEVEVRGEAVDDLVRPVAAALLKGLLERGLSLPVNFINAPLLAEEQDIAVSQSSGVSDANYPNLISCLVHWSDGESVLSGTLFGGNKPRIVQLGDYQLDANPEGVVLIMQNRDVPGVIGQVGTILAAYDVNIGEWRMGRDAPGSEALSFINLDSQPPEAVLQALEKIPAVTNVRIVTL
ncbi:MAG TPA: phosphoglycerate dehydrogenase [Candidatus Sulfomarinibacteraceae bacterium]|nr:phosphoglycerate dehydrogenase [Candidatus Sulfomarinibacteraceae bacterium]